MSQLRKKPVQIRYKLIEWFNTDVVAFDGTQDEIVAFICRQYTINKDCFYRIYRYTIPTLF